MCERSVLATGHEHEQTTKEVFTQATAQYCVRGQDRVRAKYQTQGSTTPLGPAAITSHPGRTHRIVACSLQCDPRSHLHASTHQPSPWQIQQRGRPEGSQHDRQAVSQQAAPTWPESERCCHAWASLLQYPAWRRDGPQFGVSVQVPRSCFQSCRQSCSVSDDGLAQKSSRITLSCSGFRNLLRMLQLSHGDAEGGCGISRRKLHRRSSTSGILCLAMI